MDTYMLLIVLIVLIVLINSTNTTNSAVEVNPFFYVMRLVTWRALYLPHSKADFHKYDALPGARYGQPHGLAIKRNPLRTKNEIPTIWGLSLFTTGNPLFLQT